MNRQLLSKILNDVKVDLTDEYLTERIKGKIGEGQKVTEVWIKDGNNLTLFWQK